NRVVEIPSPTGTYSYILLEDVILACLDSCFGSYKPLDRALIRVTRNADIDPDGEGVEEEEDYRQHMKRILKKRLRLQPVVLAVSGSLEKATLKTIRKALELSRRSVFTCDIPLDLGYVFGIEGKIPEHLRNELLFTPFRPQPNPTIDMTRSIREQVLQGDKLLFYPYEAMNPFLDLVHEAAYDPECISLRITLYRVAKQSRLCESLIDAAENGKEVTVLMELRARFDEQNNIDWSKQLEDAGCTVFYGFDDYKVHSKLTLITSRVNGQYKYLTQIGTGNYNEKTSELYTDLSFITTRQEIGEEASAVFNNMALQRLTSEADTMLVAPLRFKTVLLEEMDRQIALAMQGKPASIILKNNSINDPQIIDKISEASCAGVRVDMIVRGICCVRAGVPGRTENVHIRSLVGRYLEHSRIYCFGSGEAMRIYIASGDFLTRNTERRVEVGVRVDDPAIAKKLRGILDLQLRDTVNAREMQPDGTYVKVRPAEGQPPVDSQMAMFGYFQNGFVQETDKPEKPKAESKPKAAAVKAAVKPVPRQRAALRPKRAGLLQSLFGRGKK
ncbi:polyphosphate kinase 1, partial [Gemmiger formicilis]|uniref:polyphosphate kinase 1 n=1 Tax=Gemmiger formicilis TaxID=745368 RepID=UPI003A9145F7